MKDYRPLLIEDLGIVLPGLEVLRLRLNEHLPEARPSAHSHRHAQLLIYLRGRGEQLVDGRRYAAQAGSVIYIAPGQRHAFQRVRERRPLCLVVDVKLSSRRENRGDPRTLGVLPTTSLNAIRARVSQLFAMRDSVEGDRKLAVGAIILDVLDAALRATGWLGELRPAGGAVTRRAEKILRTTLGDPEMSLEALAGKLGFQRDHLNRVLKKECGLTLGQMRARRRLEEAQRLLGRGRPVGEVASAVGIDDQNYFARWFRGQTGETPTGWRG